MSEPMSQAERAALYDPDGPRGADGWGGGSFFRQAWVQSYLPVLASVFLHAMVVLTGVAFVALGGVELVAPPVQQEQLVITDSAYIDDAGEIGGLTNPGLSDDLATPAAQLEDADVTASDSFTDSRNEELTESLVTAGGSDSAAAVIGAGEATRGVVGGPGSAFGGGGKLAPFGRPGGGGGLGPGSTIFGSTSNLRSIAYVCDASGSMGQGRDRALLRELRESIAGLKPVQFFNVLFFSSGEPQVLSTGSLIPAKASAKAQANAYIDRIEFTGSTNPLPALETAFRQRPQLVVILTDGRFTSPRDAIELIQRLNADQEVRVNTIFFNNNEDDDAMDTLRTIAEQNGGSFRWVRPDDVR